MNNEIQRQHTNARMSKIVKCNGMVFLCGQTATGSGSEGGDVCVQTHETLARIDALLAEAGTDRSRILSALIHLPSMDDFSTMNSVWESWVAPGTAPARTTVQAALASPSLLVEITVIAAAR